MKLRGRNLSFLCQLCHRKRKTSFFTAVQQLNMQARTQDDIQAGLDFKLIALNTV